MVVVVLDSDPERGDDRARRAGRKRAGRAGQRRLAPALAPLTDPRRPVRARIRPPSLAGHVNEILPPAFRVRQPSAAIALALPWAPAALGGSMELQPIIWVIPIAGLAAIAFALYLARDVLRADTGTDGDAGDRRARSTRAPSPSSVASTGPSPCSPSAAPCDRPRHRARRGPEVADTDIFGLRARHPDRRRLPGRRGLLDGLRHHRHVHQRPGQPAHRRGGAAQPGASGAGRAARRRRLGLPGRGAVAARRVRHLRRVRRLHAAPSRRPS